MAARASPVRSDISPTTSPGPIVSTSHSLPSGSRIRARFTVQAVDEVEGGEQGVVLATVEREGGDKPVCVAESLTRGSRVLVTGRLRQRSWETPEGDKRSTVEIEADEVGPSLRWATAKVEKSQ
mgnify:CR=1 FL=1